MRVLLLSLLLPLLGFSYQGGSYQGGSGTYSGPPRAIQSDATPPTVVAFTADCVPFTEDQQRAQASLDEMGRMRCRRRVTAGATRPVTWGAWSSWSSNSSTPSLDFTDAVNGGQYWHCECEIYDVAGNPAAGNNYWGYFQAGSTPGQDCP